MLLIPLAAFLIAFGRDLLSFWVGRQYRSAYSLLVLLTLGLGTAATQCCIQSMLFGIERHKALVWYRLSEGLSVLVLGSIALKFFGLETFAAVICVTLLATSLILVPRHLCQILGLALRKYWSESILKPCVLSLPVAAAFVVIDRSLPIQGWRDLLLAGFAGGSVYALTLLVAGFASARAADRWYAVGVLSAISQRFLPALSARFQAGAGQLAPREPQAES